MEYQSNINNSAYSDSNDAASSNAGNPPSGRKNRKPAYSQQQTTNQRQTAQQIISANVQSLIEQLEAGHSEALTA
ncbi:hypothetical protein [Granulicella sp. dw_53]|uniref:hypothetical protein n=1 Tax=Granulicella sp. dw_53 TaxID=2719792 RepID=UPI001BD5B329|nr:hypothetical protein [Granulicella sp. dw_53]